MLTICVETARKESYVTDFRTAENGLIVIQAKKYHITGFFHNNHLWHIEHQLAVVLLFSLHQNSVFEAIWQELPLLFTSERRHAKFRKCAFHRHFLLLSFDAVPSRN